MILCGVIGLTSIRLELDSSAVRVGDHARDFTYYGETEQPESARSGFASSTTAFAQNRFAHWILTERTIWIADAHRDDGNGFVVRADEKLTAFVELESAIRELQRRPGNASSDSR
jgi:hypothetical protein